jgi:NRPS condensation-like uncharacterized protein
MNLTDIEKTFLKYDRQSPANVAAIFYLEGIPDADKVEKALNMAKNRHPYLQYHIDRVGDDYCFIHDPEKPVPFTVFEKTDQNFWIKICEEEINIEFDIYKAPMMKAYLIQEEKGNSVLIVSFSHIIADGVNSVQFVRDVIYLLGKLMAGERPTIDPLPLVRPDTVYFSKPAPVNPDKDIEWVQNDNFRIQPSSPDWDLNHGIFSYTLEGTKKRSRFVPINLSKEESTNIFARCKEKNITINSLLSISLIFAMLDYICEKGIDDSNLWIKVSTAIDLRKWIDKVSPSDFGMWAGRSVLYSKISKDVKQYDFSLAYHSLLSRYIEFNPFFYSNQMIEKFTKESHVPSSVKNPVQYYPNIKITNLGNLNTKGILSSYGDMKVKRVGFVTPLHREWINDLGFGLCASGFDSQLILNFIYMEPARTEEEAHAFIHRVIQHMNR